MNTTNIFMKGNWKNLIVSTFEVKKEILEAYLPKDTMLDLFHGKALMSMVAFTFSNVDFFGIKVPLHQNFGQINFRFYVKSKIDNTSGVVFIKEFAPKPIIAMVANIFYNEPYYFKNIKLSENFKDEELTIQYSYKNIKIEAQTKNSTKELQHESMEYFVVDRYIAYVKSKNNKTLQYKINHKPWELYETANTTIDTNILNLLPTKFETAKLLSTCFVNGSAVTVEKGILQH